MSQYARLMLHAPYGGCYGNKEELRSVSDELASLEDTLADMYASRLGKTREEIKDTYFDGKDHWITAKEAKEMGLVDGIYDIKEKVDAQSPQDIYAVFQARLNSQSFNTHNNMFEELRKRPSFAACATDEDVMRMLASMENKAGQYDAVVKERNELKASLDEYAQKRRKPVSWRSRTCSSRQCRRGVSLPPAVMRTKLYWRRTSRMARRSSKVCLRRRV